MDTCRDSGWVFGKMRMDEYVSGALKQISENCNPILVGYGGSIAYGTNLPTSDVDIRGIYMNPLDEFIGMNNSEQYSPGDADITIYSIKKIFNLLSQCNPNVIEMLGLKPEHYLLLTAEGKKILENSKLFLSQTVAKSFGGYAQSQLNRLANKSGRALEKYGSNEVRSMRKAILSIKDREKVKHLYVEEIDNVPYIYFSEKLPLDKFFSITGELANIHSDYKTNVRNTKAVEHSKLAKHMMHLLRLYMMGIDILKDGEIITYREKEHDLLMSIRNGEYLEEDGATVKENFFGILDYYKNEFEKAVSVTDLPKRPDMKKINQLMMEVVQDYYCADIDFGD